MDMRMQMLLCVAILAAAASADTGVNASGGDITPVDLNLDQAMAQWYFFYSSPNVTANTTISLNGIGYGASNNFRPIALPSTAGNYLISDSSDPFGTELQAANLSEFDAHFNISEVESSTQLFTDTAGFSSQEGVSTPALSLDLPTLYIPGANSTQAFKVGLAQAGQNFVFVVPQSSNIGMDGQAYDYQFFLPYTDNSMTFYVFSVVPPTLPNDTGGTVDQGGEIVTPSLDYRWYYDGAVLQIITLSDVSISLIDVMGKSYNANSGQSGKAVFEVFSGRYVLRMSKNGYKDLTDTIYLPQVLVKENVTTNKPTDNQNKVTVERSQEGVTVCIGEVCYFQGMADADSTRMLSDLTCTGSLCELVDIAPSEFVAKHQLRRISVAGVSATNRPAVLNITAQLNALGKDLSARLGGRGEPASPTELAAIIVGLLAIGLAVFWGSKYLAAKKIRPRGGYG